MIKRPSRKAVKHRNEAASAHGAETYDRYPHLLDNMLEGCQILGRDWRYLYLNTAAQVHNRRPNAELMGQSYTEMWPGIEDTHIFRAIKRCMEEQVATRLENKFGYPDGAVAWFELSIQPVPEGVFILSIDVTERKQAEQAYVEGQQRFKALIENSAEQISILSQDGELLYENPTAWPILDYPHGAMAGQSIWDLVHPDDLPRLKAEFELLVENPDVRPRDQFRLRRSDGSWRWVEGVGTNLLAEPSIRGIVLNYRDVTDRKLTEARLVESEDRYRDLVENSHDLICTHDLDGNLLSVNPHAGVVLGYTTDELLRMKLCDLLTPEDEKYFRRYLSNIRQEGIALGDMHVRTRSGQVRTWEYRNTLRTQGLRTPIVRGMARDVTEQRQAEEKLRQSERDLAEAQQVAHIGSWVRDAATGEVRWSDALYEIFGMTPGAQAELFEQFTGHVHPDDLSLVLQHIEQGASTGRPYQHEYRIVKANGEIRTLLTLGKAARGPDGNVTRLFGTTQDITEQKRAEEKLRQSERELAEAQRIARLGSWSREEPSGLVRWSDEVYRIYGIAPGTPINYETFLSRVRPEDIPLVEQHTERALATGEEFQYEFRIVLDGGETRTIVEVGHATRDANGRVTGLFGIAQDITERRQADDQLRYQAALLANINDAIIATDADFHITSWNRAAESMFGWKSEEVLGKNIRDILPHAEGSQGVRPADAGDDHFRGEYALARKDGTSVWLETSYMTMRDAVERVTARVGVSRDITGRKRAEQRERRQMQQLLALREIDTAITSSFDQRFTLNMLLAQVIASLDVDAADVLLLNPFMNTLNLTASRGFHQPPSRIEIPLSAQHSGEAARERRLVAEPDLRKSPHSFARSDMISREEFRSYFAMPLIAKGEVKGVLEIFHRSPLSPDSDWVDFLQTLAGQAAIAIDNAQLFEGLQRSNFELGIAYDSTIEGWSRALDLRDKETEGHTQRVTEMAVTLARKFGFSEEQLLHVRRGALLHDIGKMGVPDAILLKPGPLTEEEWVIMKKHPTFAHELLSPIRYLKAAALEIPYCHHERWDGSGYPRGLNGEQIPFGARIFAVVDVWDALTSDRPYRPAWSREKAIEYIQSQSGIQFDSRVVEGFLKLV